MAPKYTDDDLSKTLDKLEGQLVKADSEEKPEDLVKSLADVAKGAVDLATEKQRTKAAKKAAKAEALAKAAKDEKDAKDKKDEKDEDDEDMPPWLKDVVHDGKAESETILAPDRDFFPHGQQTNAGKESRGMGKSVQLLGQDVVDVEGYLNQQLTHQVELTKSLKKLNKLNKALVMGLMAQEKRLKRVERQGDEQARYTAVCAKALGSILSRREAVLDAPGASKFGSMEKSIAAAQQHIDAEGGTVFKMTPQNKELLQKAVMSGKLSQEQMTFIRRTERLPAGLALN
jgi:hypothetical protein